MKEDLAWAQALESMMKNKEDKVPPEWRAPEQLAKAMGYCEEMAKMKCRELVKAGLAERKNFRVRWGKFVRARPHYRLVSGKTRPDGAAQRRS